MILFNFAIYKNIREISPLFSFLFYRGGVICEHLNGESLFDSVKLCLTGSES